MIVKYNNAYLQKLFECKQVIGKPKFAVDIILRYKKTVIKLQFAENIKELRKYKGLNFEALKGDLKGYYSVRVDKQYRLILSIGEDKAIIISEIIIIEELSKHYE